MYVITLLLLLLCPHAITPPVPTSPPHPQHIGKVRAHLPGPGMAPVQLQWWSN